MNHLTVEDLNPEDRLSAAIAATFAISVSHLHTGPILNRCLIKLLQWDRYTEEELRANFHLAWGNSDGSDASEAIVQATFLVYSSVCTNKDTYKHSYYAHYAALAAPKVRLGCVSELEFIHNSLKALLPLIINYKINNSKRAFESPDKVLDLLEDKYKPQFLFNLDMLT